MSIEAHSFLDNGLLWSRDEINVWLDAQPANVQDMARDLGRKWLSEGRDIVVGFNIFRYLQENPHLVGIEPAQPVRMNPTGFFGGMQKIVLAWRQHQINNNLRNLGSDLNQINQSIQSLAK